VRRKQRCSFLVISRNAKSGDIMTKNEIVGVRETAHVKIEREGEGAICSLQHIGLVLVLSHPLFLPGLAPALVCMVVYSIRLAFRPTFHHGGHHIKELSCADRAQHPPTSSKYPGSPVSSANALEVCWVSTSASSWRGPSSKMSVK
jgi:hypothetical protein